MFFPNKHLAFPLKVKFNLASWFFLAIFVGLESPMLCGMTILAISNLIPSSANELEIMSYTDNDGYGIIGWGQQSKIVDCRLEQK